jgi:signal transduction histidine kinase
MQPHDHVQTAASSFLPHGFCYLWNPGLLWTHVTADFLIGTAYVVISVALAWLVHRVRRDIPFSWVFVAFGLFIITGGITHFMSIVTLWHPIYWISGGMKVITAVASVATAIAMPFTVPPIVATVRDARLSREREIAAARAIALQEQNEMLQVALAAAESAHSAKTAFLRTMSHELRTPLNAILGYQQLMEAGLSGPVTEEQRGQLQRIHRSAKHLQSLVDDVLTIGRTEVAATMAVTAVDVREMVVSAMEMVEGAARERGVALTLGPVAEVTLHTDAGRLRQILINLLANAVKFTDAGSVTLSVEDGVTEVAFVVTDTGIGIDAADQDRVFDPFWQAEQTTTRTRGGSGLGLSVSRQLARLLGGEITLSSEPGRGSTFMLTLPVQRPAS